MPESVPAFDAASEPKALTKYSELEEKRDKKTKRKEITATINEKSPVANGTEASPVDRGHWWRARVAEGGGERGWKHSGSEGGKAEVGCRQQTVLVWGPGQTVAWRLVRQGRQTGGFVGSHVRRGSHH